MKMDKCPDKFHTSVMRARTVAADGIVSRPRTELDAVWFPASNATRQVPAIRSHVPEALTPVALENPVARLEASRLEEVADHPRARLQWSTVASRTSSPPALRNRAESRGAKEVQALT